MPAEHDAYNFYSTYNIFSTSVIPFIFSSGCQLPLLRRISVDPLGSVQAGPRLNHLGIQTHHAKRRRYRSQYPQSGKGFSGRKQAIEYCRGAVKKMTACQQNIFSSIPLHCLALEALKGFSC